MINAIFVRTRVIARLQQIPLGPYLEQLATVLHRQGYAPSSIQDCLRAGDKFGYWLQRQGPTATRIDEALLESYVSGLDQWLTRYEHYLEQVVGAAATPASATEVLFDGLSLRIAARMSLTGRD